jgi:hypothetical protein
MTTTALAQPDHLARVATQALTNARRVGELATAAVAVIDQRTRQIGAAIGDPVALAAPEFTRMVSEKLEAVALAGRALQRGGPPRCASPKPGASSRPRSWARPRRRWGRLVRPLTL